MSLSINPCELNLCSTLNRPPTHVYSPIQQRGRTAPIRGHSDITMGTHGQHRSSIFTSRESRDGRFRAH